MCCKVKEMAAKAKINIIIILYKTVPNFGRNNNAKHMKAWLKL